jgi:hypothetical protein
VGWCRYRHHADGIESFLQEHGIGVNSEGEFHLLDDNQDVK